MTKDDDGLEDELEAELREAIDKVYEVLIPLQEEESNNSGIEQDNNSEFWVGFAEILSSWGRPEELNMSYSKT
jgi:hypothetical protein